MAIDVALGMAVFVDVTASNTGSISGTGYIRCTLVPEGQVTGIDLFNLNELSNKDIAVTLARNEQTTVTFVETIPTTASLGLYDTVVIARSGPDLTGDVLVEITEPDQVNIVGQFSLEIVDIFEFT